MAVGDARICCDILQRSRFRHQTLKSMAKSYKDHSSAVFLSQCLSLSGPPFVSSTKWGRMADVTPIKYPVKVIIQTLCVSSRAQHFLSAEWRDPLVTLSLWVLLRKRNGGPERRSNVYQVTGWDVAGGDSNASPGCKICSPTSRPWMRRAP